MEWRIGGSWQVDQGWREFSVAEASTFCKYIHIVQSPMAKKDGTHENSLSRWHLTSHFPLQTCQIGAIEVPNRWYSCLVHHTSFDVPSSRVVLVNISRSWKWYYGMVLIKWQTSGVTRVDGYMEKYIRIYYISICVCANVNNIQHNLLYIMYAIRYNTVYECFIIVTNRKVSPSILPDPIFPGSNHKVASARCCTCQRSQLSRKW